MSKRQWDLVFAIKFFALVASNWLMFKIFNWDIDWNQVVLIAFLFTLYFHIRDNGVPKNG